MVATDGSTQYARRTSRVGYSHGTNVSVISDSNDVIRRHRDTIHPEQLELQQQALQLQ